MKGDDGSKLIRKDLEELMLKMLRQPSPFLGKGSSILSNTGGPYNKVTVLGGAGGVSVGPMTLKTQVVPSSGSAVSATSYTPPEWYLKKRPTDPRNFKAHLIEPDQPFMITMCGKEGVYDELRGKPHPARMCKTCLKRFKKNVLEGRYAR